MKRCFLLLSTIGILFISQSCSPQPKIFTLSEAQQKFIQLCKNEYNLDVTLKQKDNTLWIYVPLNSPLFDYKAVEKKEIAKKKSTEIFNIKLLKAEYENNILQIHHHIVKEIHTPSEKEDPGFKNYQPEELSKIYQNVFTTVQRIYFNVDQVPGDVTFVDKKKQRSHKELVNSYVKTEQPPDFFVVQLVDTQRGIKAEYINNLKDYKRYSTQSLPHEEYILRSINTMEGDPKMIDNRNASGLDFQPITWKEFFRRQLLHRINFKFTQSSHPPTGTIEETIEKIIEDIDKAYPDQDFGEYVLKGLEE